jgi:hypothetical protein
MRTKQKSISNAQIKWRLVNQLESNLLSFRDICLEIPEDSVDPILRQAIYELGIDIIHFIDQYRMTDKSITDINNLPGGQKNHDEREYFREAVIKHQNHSPKKFPKWSEFSETLDRFNISRIKQNKSALVIERRTYDKWIQWWKNKEFDHLVHN